MNRLVIGSGACGFLRINHLLKSIGIDPKYKGGRVKYQNGFETWNPSTGLIWDSSGLATEDRLNRAKHYLNHVVQGGIDIAHYPLPYIKELIELDPNIRILCLHGKKEHSINSLSTHWGYMNPLVDRRGTYRARYPLEQFPEFTGMGYKEATIKYWEQYYKAANEFAILFPRNFLLVDSYNIFEPEADEYQTRKLVAEFFDNLNIISALVYPIDYESNITTVTNHGGLGNNLMQMAFSIGFCKEFNLPKPTFGTWKLQNGGGLFPTVYNADRFLGGHTGIHQDMKETFESIDWKGELDPGFDIKYMINDMFAANKFHHMRKEIVEALQPSDKINKFIDEKYGSLFSKPTISLHVRTCSLEADDHNNGSISLDQHKEALKYFDSNGINVLVFSDNNGFASKYINELKKVSSKQFHLIEENQFKSLFIASKCDNHVAHVSTLSFWISYLSNQSNGETIYFKEFEKCHTNQMIHPNLGWDMIDC